MRARDIMTEHVYTVHPWTTVKQAAAIAARHQVTGLPVVDDEDRLVGIVSEGDLLRRRLPADVTARMWSEPDETVADPPATVAEVMTKTVVTMGPAAEPADLAQTMFDKDIRSIPIVDGSTVVGIVSRRDLLRTMIRADDSLAAEIQRRLDEYAGRAGRWQVSVADGVATVFGAFQDDAEHRVVKILAATVAGVTTVHLNPSAGTPPPGEDVSM
jgi:CBS domain-containing protein